MPYRPIDPEQYRDPDWLEKKYQGERLSTSEIADICDCSKETIRRWLHRHEIEPRDSAEATRVEWEGADRRRKEQAEWMREIRSHWTELDEETQQQVREKLSNWWSENNPMEGRTGEDNPAWRGGGNRKYYGPNWEEQRERALERDGHECQGCGSIEDLVVHHHIPIRHWRNEDGRDIRNANQLWNLITVCSECHGSIEGKRYQ